jgi:hypothetical protein
VIVGAVVLRPAGSAIQPLAGIGLGLLLLLYAVWLLDPSPADVPERSNLLFALAVLGLWVTAEGYRLQARRGIGVLAGLILLAGLVVILVSAPPGPTGPPDATSIAVIGAGLILLGGWASSLLPVIRSGRSLGWIATPSERPPAAPLSWRWGVPIPGWVTVFARVAAAAAIYDGVLRLLLVPAFAQTTPIEIVEVGLGLGWIGFVLGLRRAAPRVGELTSTGVALVEVFFPIGLVGSALFGGAIIAASSSAFVPKGFQPVQVSNVAAVLVAISVARLAWVQRVERRGLGVAIALILVVGGYGAAAAGANQPIAIIAQGGALAAAVAWLAFGAWLWRLGGRLRGAFPIAAFAAPRGALAVVGPRPVPRAARQTARRAARPTVRARSEWRDKRWRKRRAKTRYDLDELALRLGVPAVALRTAAPTYAIFAIPKRSGGTRTIAAPDAPTKAVQRRVLRRLLARLPAHDAAHGFERGRSIVTNAARHAAPAVLVKLDIEDFFGQTRTVRIRRYWRVLGWDRESARILTRLTTYSGGLPQGAPTSPRLANLVNVRLDARLSGIAAVHGAVYTRYADDLTFSFAADDGPAVRQLIHTVRRICGDEGRYRLHLNRKVEIRRRHERQEITGLIVNDGRPRLGRARRRWLRAVEYRRYSGGSPTIDDAALRGWQALESMVEAQGGPSRPTA